MNRRGVGLAILLHEVSLVGALKAGYRRADADQSNPRDHESPLGERSWHGGNARQWHRFSVPVSPVFSVQVEVEDFSQSNPRPLSPAEQGQGEPE